MEAVSSHRPYRPALGIEEGIAVIKANRGTHYNPEIVDICIDLIFNKNFNFNQNDKAA